MKDALVTGTRVLGSAVDLGLERIGDAFAAAQRNDPAHVPSTSDDVTPAWATAVLQQTFPGIRVRSLTRRGGDAGTTERARFEVDYDTAGTGERPPSSVFLKLAPRDVKTRVFVNLMALGANEVRFYRDIAPELPIDVPRALHAACTGRARRFVLVLEDLAARGARFTNVSYPVTVDEARAVMLTLARLHASFWNSPRLSGELAWLRRIDRNHNYPVERFLCAAAIPAALRRHADLVPEDVREAAPRIVAARDRLETAWATGSLTLIHGDAHVGNMYFCGGNAGLLDWQVVQCGQGMRDVAYFLANSLRTEIRRMHEHDLIRTYLAALGDLGVRAPHFASAWLQYRLHALYAWIAAAVTAAAATLQTEAIVRAGLARTSTAVADLESVEAMNAWERRIGA